MTSTNVTQKGSHTGSLNLLIVRLYPKYNASAMESIIVMICAKDTMSIAGIEAEET